MLCLDFEYSRYDPEKQGSVNGTPITVHVKGPRRFFPKQPAVVLLPAVVYQHARIADTHSHRSDRAG